MQRLTLSIALAALLLLAGCGAPGPAGTAKEKEPRDPTDPALGWIEGLVTDDEFTPLQGAQVATGQGDLMTSTDDLGIFRLDGLEPGAYVLGVAKVGFSSAVKRVSVKPGERSEAIFALEPVPLIEVPYHDTVTKVAQIHASQIYLTYALWGAGVNNSAYNQLVCDPCRFTLQFAPGAEQVRSEAFFKAGTRNPAVNNQVYVSFSRNASANYGTQLHVTYYKHLDSKTWGSEKTIGKDRKLDLWINGDLAGINHELRVEMYTTFAYHGKLAEGYTALPPP